MPGQIPSYSLKNALDLDVLLEDIGDARVVLLGEASHGTSEYYSWRMAISKRLIREKGFSFLAVEGDWPDCYAVNRFVKGYFNIPGTAHEVLKTFSRWPTWMWANWEIVALAEWLREHNRGKKEEEKAGFYGLDMYSLWESLHEIVNYLERHDGQMIEAAKEAFHCFEPFGKDPQKYARATASLVPQNCEDEVVELLQTVLGKAAPISANPEDFFNTEQNAQVAVSAEKYYRTMIRGGGASWNVRDTHMIETLGRLLEHKGKESKAIVWEHNTHVGDARATDMADEGMVNVGQLAREVYGSDKVYIVGFGSYEGTVIAGHSWGSEMQKMKMPRARAGSWEAMLHEDSADDRLMLSKELSSLDKLKQRIGHRAIGVVYNPEFERYGNYVPSLIPERYDAFLYFDKTHALNPLHIKTDTGQPPELYPWNF